MIALGMTLQVGAWLWGMFGQYGGFQQWWNAIQMEGGNMVYLFLGMFALSLIIQATYLAGTKGIKAFGYLITLYMLYQVGLGGYGLYQEYMTNMTWTNAYSGAVIYFAGLTLGALGSFVQSQLNPTPPPPPSATGQYKLILV